ncbi:MAG: nucleotide exchange factor GrpE [Bacteroidales bacterium]|nr:nucleotide exchange factor GrpE [Bacteroidales bacterium]
MTDEIEKEISWEDDVLMDMMKDPSDESPSAEQSEPTSNPKVEYGNIDKHFSELKDQIKCLEDKFDSKIAEDEQKNNMLKKLYEELEQKNMHFDKLYAELDSYKKDLYAKMLSPFINETITLLSDYERLIEMIDTFDNQRLINCIKDIPDDLERLLDNNGVERYSDDSTDKFNPKTQRVIKNEFTGDKNADKTVAEHIRKGYRWNGSVIRPEMVSIYIYKEGYENKCENPPQQETEQDVTEEQTTTN